MRPDWRRPLSATLPSLRSPRARRAREAVLDDLRVARAEVALRGQSEQVAALVGGGGAVQLGVLTLAWCGLAGGTAATLSGAWWLLPALLLWVAATQRLHGNVVHEAAHGNLIQGHRPRWWRWLAAPLFEDFDRYRRNHLLHHAYLGVWALDFDVIEEAPDQPQWLWTALDPGAWLGHLVGDLLDMGWTARWRVLASWVAIGGALSVWDPRLGAATFLVWVLARGTSFRLLHVLVQHADHFPLPGPGIFRQTRNAPSGIGALWLHPMGDNWHLAHHLYPHVPSHRLARVHKILLETPTYSGCEHLDGYRDLLRSWRRRSPDLALDPNAVGGAPAVDPAAPDRARATLETSECLPSD